VIDRFASSPKGEGDLAVLHLPDDAESAAPQPPPQTPPPKAEEGSWLNLDIVAGRDTCTRFVRFAKQIESPKAAKLARLRKGDYN